MHTRYVQIAMEELNLPATFYTPNKLAITHIPIEKKCSTKEITAPSFQIKAKTQASQKRVG